MPDNTLRRNSAIEMLKIIAMGLIMVAHVTQTLGTLGTDYDYLGCFIDQNISTANPQYIILTLFRYFGTIGNDIFFICSAWFLAYNRSEPKKVRIAEIITDTWMVSVLFCICIVPVIVLKGGVCTHERHCSVFFPSYFSYKLVYHMLCNFLFYLSLHKQDFRNTRTKRII